MTVIIFAYSINWSYYISDEMKSTQLNITHNHITSHFRWDASNPTKHNTQLHHILDEMQSTKYNTHSHLHIKIYEQWSYFVLDAHFVQNERSKRTLGI